MTDSGVHGGDGRASGGGGVVGGADPAAVGAEERDRIRDHLRDLDSVRGAVLADRDLAMYRAHERGIPIEEIARWAGVPATDTRRIVEELSHEDDVDEWEVDGSWVRLYSSTDRY